MTLRNRCDCPGLGGKHRQFCCLFHLFPAVLSTSGVVAASDATVDEAAQDHSHRQGHGVTIGGHCCRPDGGGPGVGATLALDKPLGRLVGGRRLRTSVVRNKKGEVLSSRGGMNFLI